MEQNRGKQISGPSEEEVVKRLEDIEAGIYIKGDVMAEIREARQDLNAKPKRAEWTLDAIWSNWVWENNMMFYPDLESESYAVVKQHLETKTYNLKVYIKGFSSHSFASRNEEAIRDLAESITDSFIKFWKATELKKD